MKKCKVARFHPICHFAVQHTFWGRVAGGAKRGSVAGYAKQIEARESINMFADESKADESTVYGALTEDDLRNLNP